MKNIIVFILLPFTFSAPAQDSRNKKDLSFGYVNKKVKPADNFYMYANGIWYDTARIATTETSSGARQEMTNLTKIRIKDILETSARATNSQGTIQQKTGDLFASGMDSNRIENLGASPIKEWLQQIDNITDIRSLVQYVGSQATMGNNSLLRHRVTGDYKDSRRNIAAFYQAGLGMPNRDYYTKPDAASQKIVANYKKYITSLFSLSGDTATASDAANTVYDVEKQIALRHLSPVAVLDPIANNNKMAVADIHKQMPMVAWQDLLQTMRIKSDSINLAQPAYYRALNELLEQIPLVHWKVYLRFHLLHAVAPLLSREFVKASFDFNQKTLLGQQEQKPRWERIYGLIDVHLGEALGELYVTKYFTAASKERMLEMVKNLKAAFAQRIRKLDWMSDSTKEKALAKLATFTPKVGYPDKWRDYSKLEIRRNDFFGNISRAKEHNYNFQVDKLVLPVDKTEWYMTPQTNNAYFNPPWNEIVFPAGILQSPMFDVAADDAMNYGGIGVVIGHEFTHGFDNRGALYDKNGNLNNWWGKDDMERFKAKGEQVVKLYNSFVVLDTVHVNGRLTQSENTADIGGLAIAYDAFKLTKQGRANETINGLSADQRFFLSFAQTWRRKFKDEALLHQVNTDVHSPSMWRPVGALMNLPAFYKAYSLKPGDKMYLPEEERILIW